MGVKRHLLVGFCGLLLFTGSIASPCAATTTISVSVQLTVHAVVPPARYIIVDDTGHMVKVLSNTVENVNPTVYKDTVLAVNQQAYTPALRSQYQQLLKHNPSFAIGVLTPKTSFVSNLVSIFHRGVYLESIMHFGSSL